MSSKDNLPPSRRKFSVFTGTPRDADDSKTPTHKSERHLVGVSEAPSLVARQLDLPGFQSKFTAGLLLISFARLTDIGISSLIRNYQPSRVIDLRIAPAYIPLANSVADFVKILSNAGIEYSHPIEIVNRFSGDAWHPERLRSRFVRQLRDNRSILAQISQWALSSTVTVISADPQIQGSDREIFAQEICRLHAHVNFRVLHD